MSQIVSEGLRERKRRATHVRIAAEAARLALEQGIAATTIDQIAEAADVGRASVFRYFDTKECAMAEGFTGVWIQMITDALTSQPSGIAPLESVRGAFAELAEGFEQIRDLTLAQAELSRSSAVLSAWTLRVHLGYEEAIAAALTPRFVDLEPDDPRPRLAAALVMASIRLALDDWVASAGSADLPALIHRNLASVSIEAAGTSPPRNMHHAIWRPDDVER